MVLKPQQQDYWPAGAHACEHVPMHMRACWAKLSVHADACVHAHACTCGWACACTCECTCMHLAHAQEISIKMHMHTQVHTHMRTLKWEHTHDLPSEAWGSCGSSQLQEPHGVCNCDVHAHFDDISLASTKKRSQTCCWPSASAESAARWLQAFCLMPQDWGLRGRLSERQAEGLKLWEGPLSPQSWACKEPARADKAFSASAKGFEALARLLHACRGSGPWDWDPKPKAWGVSHRAFA